MSDDLVKRLRELAGRYDEAAERIEKLEAALDEAAFRQTLFDAVVGQRNKATDRIEKLEAALREIKWIATPDHEEARYKSTEIARRALEGKMSDRYIFGNPDTLEAMRLAGHVAKLEAHIEKLEAALREIAEANSVQAGTDKNMYRRWQYVATNAIDIARKALEEEDD
jgi:BMFP domain-containing protein YqiC